MATAKVNAIIIDEVESHTEIAMDSSGLSDKTSWIRVDANGYQLGVERRKEVMNRMVVELFEVVEQSGERAWPFSGTLVKLVEETGSDRDGNPMTRNVDALLYDAMSPLMLGDLVRRARDGALRRICGGRIEGFRCVINQKNYAAVPVERNKGGYRNEHDTETLHKAVDGRGCL